MKKRRVERLLAISEVFKWIGATLFGAWLLTLLVLIAIRLTE